MSRRSWIPRGKTFRNDPPPPSAAGDSNREAIPVRVLVRPSSSTDPSSSGNRSQAPENTAGTSRTNAPLDVPGDRGRGRGRSRGRGAKKTRRNQPHTSADEDIDWRSSPKIWYSKTVAQVPDPPSAPNPTCSTSTSTTTRALIPVSTSASAACSSTSISGSRGYERDDGDDEDDEDDCGDGDDTLHESGDEQIQISHVSRLLPRASTLRHLVTIACYTEEVLGPNKCNIPTKWFEQLHPELLKTMKILCSSSWGIKASDQIASLIMYFQLVAVQAPKALQKDIFGGVLNFMEVKQSLDDIRKRHPSTCAQAVVYTMLDRVPMAMNRTHIRYLSGNVSKKLEDTERFGIFKTCSSVWVTCLHRMRGDFYLDFQEVVDMVAGWMFDAQEGHDDVIIYCAMLLKCVRAGLSCDERFLSDMCSIIVTQITEILEGKKEMNGWRLTVLLRIVSILKSVPGVTLPLQSDFLDRTFQRMMENYKRLSLRKCHVDKTRQVDVTVELLTHLNQFLTTLELESSNVTAYIRLQLQYTRDALLHFGASKLTEMSMRMTRAYLRSLASVFVSWLESTPASFREEEQLELSQSILFLVKGTFQVRMGKLASERLMDFGTEWAYQVLQALLGHSSIKFVSNVYSWLMEPLVANTLELDPFFEGNSPFEQYLGLVLCILNPLMLENQDSPTSFWSMEPCLADLLIGFLSRPVSDHQKMFMIDILQNHCHEFKYFVSPFLYSYFTEVPYSKTLPQLLALWTSVLDDPSDSGRRGVDCRNAMFDWIVDFLETTAAEVTSLIKYARSFYERLLDVSKLSPDLFSRVLTLYQKLLNNAYYAENSLFLDMFSRGFIQKTIGPSAVISCDTRNKVLTILQSYTSLVVINRHVIPVSSVECGMCPHVALINDSVGTVTILPKKLLSRFFVMLLSSVKMSGDDKGDGTSCVDDENEPSDNRFGVPISAEQGFVCLHCIRLAVNRIVAARLQSFGWTPTHLFDTLRQLITSYSESQNGAFADVMCPAWKLNFYFTLENAIVDACEREVLPTATVFANTILPWFVRNKEGCVLGMLRMRPILTEVSLRAQLPAYAYYFSHDMDQKEMTEKTLMERVQALLLLKDKVALRSAYPDDLAVKLYLEGHVDAALRQKSTSASKVVARVIDQEVMQRSVDNLKYWDKLKEQSELYRGIRAEMDAAKTVLHVPPRKLFVLDLASSSKDIVRMPTNPEFLSLNRLQEVSHVLQTNARTKEDVSFWKQWSTWSLQRMSENGGPMASKFPSVSHATVRVPLPGNLYPELEIKLHCLETPELVPDVIQDQDHTFHLLTNWLDLVEDRKIKLLQKEAYTADPKRNNIFLKALLQRDSEPIPSPPLPESYKEIGVLDMSQWLNLAKYNLDMMDHDSINSSPVERSAIARNLCDFLKHFDKDNQNVYCDNEDVGALMVKARVGLLQLHKEGFCIDPAVLSRDSGWFDLLPSLCEFPEFRQRVMDLFPSQAPLYLWRYAQLEKKGSLVRGSVIDHMAFCVVTSDSFDRDADTLLSLRKPRNSFTITLPSGVDEFMCGMSMLGGSPFQNWSWTVQRFYKVDWASNLFPNLREDWILDPDPLKIGLYMKAPVSYLWSLWDDVSGGDGPTPSDGFGEKVSSIFVELSNSGSLDEVTDHMAALINVANEIERWAALEAREVGCLKSISPILAKMDFQEVNIWLPGCANGVHVVSVDSELTCLLDTMTKPKRISFRCSDGMKRSYLVKGKENVHVDQLIMQFLRVSNRLLNAETRTYAVIPFATDGGIIQMVENVTSVFNLYQKTYLEKGLEPRVGAYYRRRLEEILADQRSEGDVHTLLFKELLKDTKRTIIAEYFVRESKTPSQWYHGIRTFTQDCALAAAYGYLIGLGDRHLDNILLDLSSGYVVHVDFGMVMDKGKSLRIPETVPFRLTGNFAHALQTRNPHGPFLEYLETFLQKYVRHGLVSKWGLNSIATAANTVNTVCKDAEFLLQMEAKAVFALLEYRVRNLIFRIPQYLRELGTLLDRRAMLLQRLKLSKLELENLNANLAKQSKMLACVMEYTNKGALELAMFRHGCGATELHMAFQAFVQETPRLKEIGETARGDKAWAAAVVDYIGTSMRSLRKDQLNLTLAIPNSEILSKGNDASLLPLVTQWLAHIHNVNILVNFSKRTLRLKPTAFCGESDPAMIFPLWEFIHDTWIHKGAVDLIQNVDSAGWKDLLATTSNHFTRIHSVLQLIDSDNLELKSDAIDAVSSLQNNLVSKRTAEKDSEAAIQKVDSFQPQATVGVLVKDAMDQANLCGMYEGWMAWV